MHFKQRALAIVLGSLFISGLAVAEDEAAVIVSATRFAEADPRVPANITVITRGDMRDTPAWLSATSGSAVTRIAMR